ncbi:MAG: hypothetical protein IJ366_09255, partial [Clostridia bacterium]|nr:hypothetical protein [Clostridia bacterium]
TDRRGLFTLKDGIKAGTTKIELTKDKYKPLSETVELAVGNVTLMYKMEKIRQKPKIVSVTPKKIGDKSEKIIIPEGLNLSDILVVETNTEESGRLTGIRLEKVSSSGEVTEINNSATSQVILETEKLSAGDTVRVVAIADSNLESEPYVLPITVKAAPFTHLLNNGSVSASYGELNAKMSFANLFKNIPDRERNYAYWLSGDAKEAWENLMAQFDTKMVVDLGAGKLETNTEFTVDWFGYNSFTVYVNYNFATGELVVSPNPVGRKYYAYTSSGMCYDGAYRTNVKLENSRYGRTTGYIRVNEEVREDIGIPSGGRYGYLVTQSDRRYYIESLFGITFKLNGDQWAGMFEMSTDESNSSYGTYLKRLKWYKNIGSWNVPETIVASWYKSVNIKEDEDIPLTTEGINNANVSMKYNAANNATWYSGVGNIVLGSETSSTISILPYHRIQGATRLTGGYYIFRYWWPLYSSQNSYLPYDLNFGRTQLLAMDENTKLSSLSAVKLSNATGDNIVDGKVYANADAALADGQNPVMVYLDENGDKPQLVAQTFKNGVWGDATALEDDRDAYYPFVAQSGDGHIAVWTNYGNENGMPTDNGELTVDEIQKNVASEMDISYGVFRNGEWTDTRDLTKSDGYLDYSPVVTAFDNSAMAVWVRNTDNDIISEERNDNLMFSVMDENGDWSTAAEIEGADGTISDLSIAEKNGVVYILYAITEDMTYKLEDGTTHTEENLKKFYMMSYTNGSWSMEKCVNQTKSPDIFCSFVEIDGKQEIILVSATTIYRIDAASRDIIEIKQVSSEMEAANEMFVACDGTSMAVVWITGEEAQKIYAMVYNSETENWSEAVEVAEVCAGYTANNISAVFADGYIEIVYNRYMHDDEGTPVEVALCSANMPYSEDTLVIADVIEIEELTLADSVVMDGNNAKFNVKLKNNGAITLENYRITLKDTSGSVLSKEFEISGPLAGGAEQELELECAVEGLTSNITVNAYVADSTVSAAECEVVVENAAITELSANPTGDGSVLVTAVVKNTGYVPVSRTLALYNVTDGTEIAFTDVEGNELKAELTLNPQQEITAEFSIPAQSVAQTVDMKAMLIHNGVDEIDSEDDHKEITYTPSSRLVLGSVAPIFREDLFGKARNGSAITVNMDNIQVDVQEDGDIIADAAVEETENAATFGVMVPVNEDVKVVVSAPGFLPRTMSAYNYDEQVDMSLFPGDVYRDTNNTIDIFDLVYMIRRLGNTDLTEEELNNAKLTNDGTDNAITVNDMTVVLQNYGTGQRHYEELDERAAAEN